MAKPFEKRAINMVEIYTDFVALIVSLSHSLFIISPEESDGIGMFIMISCITAIAASLCMGLVDSISKLKEWLKNRKSKIQNSDSP